MTTTPTFIEPRRPQDMKPKQLAAALKKGPVHTSVKVDGIRIHIIIADDGSNAILRSRTNKPFRALGLLEQRLNAPWLADLRIDLRGQTLECEVQAVDTLGDLLSAAKTNGALNTSEQVLPGRLNWTLFDAHCAETRSLDIEARIALVGLLHATLIQRALGPYTVRHGRILSDLEAIQSHYEGSRILGYEGLVITPLGVPYASGKKLNSGWKMKPSETKDGIVTGFVEAVSAEGVPLGMVGSLQVTFEDGTEGLVGAGALTHDERWLIWQDQPAYIGRCLEAKAMETNEETGALRHPTFLRWRDDILDKGVKQ